MRGKRFRFETRNQPLLSRAAFAIRMLKYFAAAMGVVFVSLFTGMLGYHFLGGMSWMDAFLNASMILSGMGPVGELKSEGIKLFAGIYALYSGLVLILTSGLLLAPLLHRLLHCFHLDEDDDKEEGR
jgi:hypothetical protein